jgi:hypothetical protein
MKIDIGEQSTNGCDRLFGLVRWMRATRTAVSMSDDWARQPLSLPRSTEFEKQFVSLYFPLLSNMHTIFWLLLWWWMKAHSNGIFFKNQILRNAQKISLISRPSLLQSC